ncbi:MAG TPA: acyl-CoA dehydrogenase family protein [Candidatus Binataceae bacterium]|nr:acyl-CoA dehydrogenase family protein [Candidatus Binataceae bacterium]
MANQAEALLTAVRELAPRISARSVEIESARRMPPDLLAELIAAGLFRMLTPRSHGGMEIDFLTSMEIIETIAAADGATGWTVMIGSETPQLLALLPRHRFDQLYADSPDLIVGGGFAPRGQAELRDGDYLVNGRWAFASGCQHSKWLIGNCIVTENGKPRAGFIPGSQEVRAMMFAPQSAKIIDTWSVNGLRGTGSHDIEVKDLRVPVEDTIDIFFGHSAIPGPLYAAHLAYFVLHIAAVGVGIASRAVREIVALASTSKKRLYTASTMADMPLFQYRVGNAETTLRAARAVLMEESKRVWETAVAGKSLIPNEQIRIVGTAAWVAHTAASIVDACYTAGGGTSLYDSSPLQRCLRDIHTLTQHAAVAENSITRAGAVLLGREVSFSV